MGRTYVVVATTCLVAQHRIKAFACDARALMASVALAARAARARRATARLIQVWAHDLNVARINIYWGARPEVQAPAFDARLHMARAVRVAQVSPAPRATAPLAELACATTTNIFLVAPRQVLAGVLDVRLRTAPGAVAALIAAARRTTAKPLLAHAMVINTLKTARR
jgi:hypothetical protein